MEQQKNDGHQILTGLQNNLAQLEQLFESVKESKEGGFEQLTELDDLLTEEREARDSLNTMYVTEAKVGSMSILGRQTKNFGRELRSEASE